MLLRWTPDLILDSTRMMILLLLSRRTPDLIASMLSWGALLQYAWFYFFQPTYQWLPWLAWHGWWLRSTLSLSWWACCDEFCCFVWLAWKKSDNATLEKQFGKRSNWQNFHNSFSVQDLIKVQQTNITTRNNGNYEFPIMYASLGFNQSSTRSPQGTMVLWIPNNVRKSCTRSSTRTSGMKTTKNIGTDSQRM